MELEIATEMILSLLRSDLVSLIQPFSQPSAAGICGGGAGGIGQSVNYPAPGYSKGSGNLSGAGGVGLQYSINGTSTYYAGGGGGHGYAYVSPGGDGGGGSAHPTVVAARGDARGVINIGGGGDIVESSRYSSRWWWKTWFWRFWCCYC